MRSNGYVIAYRSTWTHPAFNNLREAAIWNFLYQNAFWQDGHRNFNGYTFSLKRGQIVVSIPFLAKGFGMTEKGVRVVIRKLEKLGMVVTQGANKGTIITICNYDKYQVNVSDLGEQDGRQRADRGQTEGDNKNKINNKINKPYDDFFERFWTSFPKQRKGSRDKAITAWQKAIKKEDPEIIIKSVESYAVSDEVVRGYAKGAAAWLNDDRWNNDYSIGGNNARTTTKTKSDRAKEAMLKSCEAIGIIGGHGSQEDVNQYNLAVLPEPETIW